MSSSISSYSASAEAGFQPHVRVEPQQSEKIRVSSSCIFENDHHLHAIYKFVDLSGYASLKLVNKKISHFLTTEMSFVEFDSAEYLKKFINSLDLKHGNSIRNFLRYLTGENKLVEDEGKAASRLDEKYGDLIRNLFSSFSLLSVNAIKDTDSVEGMIDAICEKREVINKIIYAFAIKDGELLESLLTNNENHFTPLMLCKIESKLLEQTSLDFKNDAMNVLEIIRSYIEKKTPNSEFSIRFKGTIHEDHMPLRYTPDLLHQFENLEEYEDFVLEFLDECGGAYKYLPEELQQKKKIFDIAAKSNGYVIGYSPIFRQIKECVKNCVETDGCALADAAPRFQDHVEIVAIAVDQCPDAIQLASERIQQNQWLLYDDLCRLKEKKTQMAGKKGWHLPQS